MDSVRPQPWRGRKKKTEEEEKGRADFLIKKEEEGDPLIQVEIKTGRNSPSKMSSFQLDHQDCDDINSFMENLNEVCYILHIQIVENLFPPTSYLRGIGCWWTDPYSFAETFTESRRRFGGSKHAAYFDADVFKPLKNFAQHLNTEEIEKVRNKFREKGPLSFY